MRVASPQAPPLRDAPSPSPGSKATMKGEGDVAVKGGLLLIKSWGKSTLALTNVCSDWMSITGNYHYVDPLACILGLYVI